MKRFLTVEENIIQTIRTTKKIFVIKNFGNPITQFTIYYCGHNSHCRPKLFASELCDRITAYNISV